MLLGRKVRRANPNQSSTTDKLSAEQMALASRGLHSAISPLTRRLLPPSQRALRMGIVNRQFVTLLVRQALRLRYWVIGGIVGGGYMADSYYERWKKSLPEFSLPDWIKLDADSLLAQKLDKWKTRWAERDRHLLKEWANKLRGGDVWGAGATGMQLGPLDSGLLPLMGSSDQNGLHLYGVKDNEGSRGGDGGRQEEGQSGGSAKPTAVLSILAGKFGFNKERKEEEDDSAPVSEAVRIQKLQDDLLKTQLQYQRELEQLERENKVLKQKLLLKDAGEMKRAKKLKRSLIDMYSDMLDLLTEYDSSYSTTDNLPRVVVVGDQSAGKTSVLEMIAQARIFPRGSGEMMTRAPVKVTLSEGPYHVAQFRDSNREFDLTREADLAQLRSEIELRMRNSVQGGKTVSNEVISLTVKGPNMPRMVLVDLPGVISTVTTEMARDTKDDIVKMCKQYMENPNAIVLCIQDGSVDAERSNVTDLVTSVDPNGQRTIVVLTKVDLAEKNLSNPNRIKKILEGRLFPMQALGYYAVVAGTEGRHNSTIDDIRKHEEEFFADSKLFRDGVLKASQMTTRNMSLAVSDCFWRMVKESIEAQADAFRAKRYNLEAEWKNTFPRKRELTRDELFDKARGEVLDEVANLSHLSAEEWETLLKKRLWEAVADHVVDQILVPASAVDTVGSFNTLIDIKLKHWAEKELANQSIEIGWGTLREVFKRQFDQRGSGKGGANGEEETVLDPLKSAVVATVLTEHKWDTKALEYLRVIQINAMADRVVPDKRQWDKSCRFMGDVASAMHREVERKLAEARGPTLWEKWFGWKSTNHEQLTNQAIQDELRTILSTSPDHRPSLLEDDLTVVRRNLEAKQLFDTPSEQIRKQWKLLFREHFLDRLVQASRDCQALYQNYKQGFADSEGFLDCQAIAFFYRLNKMLNLSCNALRQQITNTEQRRLEKETKDLLDDWSQDVEVKKQHLTGRQVELAEELDHVRHIQERLEKFMTEFMSQ